MQVDSFKITLLKSDTVLENNFWSYIGLMPPCKVPYIVINLLFNDNLSFTLKLNHSTWNNFRRKLKKRRNIYCTTDRKNGFKIYFKKHHINIYSEVDGVMSFIHLENNNLVDDVIENL